MEDVKDQPAEPDDSNEMECPKCFNPHARGVMLHRDMECGGREAGKISVDVPVPTIICTKCGARSEAISPDEIEKVLAMAWETIGPQMAEREEQKMKATVRYMVRARRFRHSMMTCVAVLVVASLFLGYDFVHWLLTHQFLQHPYYIAHHFLVLGVFIWIANRLIGGFTGEREFWRALRKNKKKTAAEEKD